MNPYLFLYVSSVTRQSQKVLSGLNRLDSSLLRKETDKWSKEEKQWETSQRASGAAAVDAL